MSTKHPWASILLNCKPSQATSRDELRPVLTYGWIEHDKDGSWLTATDSYILARIPIWLDVVEIEERRTLLPEVLIPQEGMRALDGASRFRIVGDLLEVEGTAARYAVASDLTHPNGAQLVQDNWERTVEPSAELFINPGLLSRLNAALGAETHGVVLEPTGPLNAIRVSIPGLPGARGLLMPIRKVQ